MSAYTTGGFAVCGQVFFSLFMARKGFDYLRGPWDG
jgi:hypothetical protein